MIFFLLLLAFLVPLAIYCLVLAMINRRALPVMVDGLWDCVGLLFAASGFLLVVAPTLLAILFLRYQREAALDPRLDQEKFYQELADIFAQWLFAWIGYYLLLVSGAVLLLWWRRGKTIIYNVDPERFLEVLARTLGQLGFAPKEKVLLPVTDAEGIIDLAKVPEARDSLADLGRQNLLSVETFAALSNVTVHWRTADPKIRQQIEEEVRKNLLEARLDDNPTGTWILGIAGMLFSMTFLVGLVIILGIYFRK